MKLLRQFITLLTETYRELSIWLLISRDKGETGNQLIEYQWGRFRVIYISGERTVPMSYSSAVDYAKIFDGKVIHIATERVVYEPERKESNEEK